MMLPRSLLLAALLLAACAAPLVAPAPPAATGPATTIYLAALAWHTGIVLRRSDVPPGLWPETRDFPHAEYLEVGWGDREFYQSPDPGLWITLRAGLLPTPSVLQVVGFAGPVAGNVRGRELISFTLTGDGFERLVRHIHDTHDRGGAPVATPLGPSLYGEGYFYPARGRFHMFHTCNVWTARALRAAGLPIQDSITSEGLMSQAREIGTVVSRPVP